MEPLELSHQLVLRYGLRPRLATLLAMLLIRDVTSNEEVARQAVYLLRKAMPELEIKHVRSFGYFLTPEEKQRIKDQLDE